MMTALRGLIRFGGGIGGALLGYFVWWLTFPRVFPGTNPVGFFIEPLIIGTVMLVFAVIAAVMVPVPTTLSLSPRGEG